MFLDVYQIFKHTHGIVSTIPVNKHLQPFTRESVILETTAILLVTIPNNATGLPVSASRTVLILKRIA